MASIGTASTLVNRGGRPPCAPSPAAPTQAGDWSPDVTILAFCEIVEGHRLGDRERVERFRHCLFQLGFEVTPTGRGVVA